MEIVWGQWNQAHITGHGGSVAMAEAIINAPDTTWTAQDEITWRGLGIITGRGWTIIVQIDARSIYPITMYPTRRGGRRQRR